MRLEDALERLLAEASPLGAEDCPVGRSHGRTAAEAVTAPHAVPHFRRSAMDGYVCHDADVRAASPDRPAGLRITGGVRMGEPPADGPARGEAWTITTGGALPRRGDRVVPVEACRASDGLLTIARAVDGRRHVVEPGEDVPAGALLVGAGQLISPADAGALAACGLSRVRVIRRPRVGLVASGSELVDPQDIAPQDAAPPPGRVVNSNSIALAGELEAAGCLVEYAGIVPDDPASLRETFASLGGRYDVIASTGGVSVGRFDLVHRTWLGLGVRRVVGRVDLKPGGPFFAGWLGTAWVVGLSGTPVACLAAFHLLVRPLLRRLGGARHAVRPCVRGTLIDGFARGADRTRALWARAEWSSTEADGPVSVEGGPPGPADDPGDFPRLTLLTRPGGGTIPSVLGANALVLLPAGTPPLPAGSRVTALLLDRAETASRLTIAPPDRAPLVVGVTGASGSGKTAMITGLTTRLAAAGCRVAVVKHAAHGFDLDRPGSDSDRVFRAGATVVVAGPDEIAARVPRHATGLSGRSGVPGLVRLAVECAVEAGGPSPDVVFVEGFSHPGEPVIQVGAQKPGADAGEVLAALPAVSQLDPPALDRALSGLAAELLRRLSGAR